MMLDLVGTTVRYEVQSWNQPEGRGYGWAPCRRTAEGATFFVFRDGDYWREFSTRDLARAAIAGAGGGVYETRATTVEDIIGAGGSA